MSGVDTSAAAVEYIIAGLIGHRAASIEKGFHWSSRQAQSSIDMIGALSAERDALRAQLATARAEALKPVLNAVADYPAGQHGNLPRDPHEVARQVTDEIFNTIRAMIEAVDGSVSDDQ